MSACALDFNTDREFECPLPVEPGCLVCNADGSCRTYAEPLTDPDPPATPDAAKLPEGPEGPSLPTDPPPVILGPVTDAGTTDPPPDARPPEPEVCPEYASSPGDSLCVDDQQCFRLGSVLSSALSTWLDPTSLPGAGSRHWCDRSGQRHHALLDPDAAALVIEPDERAVSAALARSFLLDGSSLWLSHGAQPAITAGNFAVVIAAAALPTPDLRAFELFEQGDQSRINLTVLPTTGKAQAKITSTQTVLADTPVLTNSSVYDGAFHLFSLFRRSAVGVLDDVLQLRLNTVLEVRGSSIAFPRALDFSAESPPRVGGRAGSGGSIVTGRGRVAAVVILRGSVPEEELLRLENFLCTALAVCTAPVTVPPAAPGSPATPPVR